MSPQMFAARRERLSLLHQFDDGQGIAESSQNGYSAALYLHRFGYGEPQQEHQTAHNYDKQYNLYLPLFADVIFPL
ncbi:hypothetical protein HMPREF3136_03770 [Neisseria sp. HMSC15C08]|nr:hypothetical protein HMPREF3136_03770 [Neisseria sp. HMSC15C08]